MSEERFDRIDERFDRIDERFDRGDERFGRIEQRLDRLEAGQNGLREDLKAQGVRLDGRLDELGRHMRLLHEEAMDSIKATREYTGPTRAEFAEMMERIGRRLDPLEATARHHSAEIERLKKRRG